MFWLYVILALAVVAGGVTAVETYNHAIRAEASAQTQAANAEARARAEKKARTDLQDLVDYGDTLAKTQKSELDARGTKIRDMEKEISHAKQRDPKAYACEDAPVPDATRELRRAAFGATGAELVLHPESGPGANAAPPVAGRDVRSAAPGGGPGPAPAAGLQREQGLSPAAPGKAEQPTSLRARLEALMRR